MKQMSNMYICIVQISTKIEPKVELSQRDNSSEVCVVDI